MLPCSLLVKVVLIGEIFDFDYSVIHNFYSLELRAKSIEQKAQAHKQVNMFNPCLETRIDPNLTMLDPI